MLMLLNTNMTLNRVEKKNYRLIPYFWRQKCCVALQLFEDHESFSYFLRFMAVFIRIWGKVVKLKELERPEKYLDLKLYSKLVINKFDMHI